MCNSSQGQEKIALFIKNIAGRLSKKKKKERETTNKEKIIGYF